MSYGYTSTPAGTYNAAGCGDYGSVQLQAPPMYAQTPYPHQQPSCTPQPPQQIQCHPQAATSSMMPTINCIPPAAIPPAPPAPPIAPMPTNVDLPVDNTCYRPPQKPCGQVYHYCVNEPTIVRSTDQHFTTCNTSVQENNVHIQHNRTVVTNVNRNHHHLHRIIVKENNYHHFLTKNIIRAHDIHHQRIERVKQEGKTTKDHKETITVEPVATCSKGTMQTAAAAAASNECPEAAAAAAAAAEGYDQASFSHSGEQLTHHYSTSIVQQAPQPMQHGHLQYQPRIVQENIIEQPVDQYLIDQPPPEEALIEEFDNDDDLTEPPEPASLIPPPPPQPPAPTNIPPIIPERYLSDSDDDDDDNLLAKYNVAPAREASPIQPCHRQSVGLHQQYQQQPQPQVAQYQPQLYQPRYDYQQSQMAANYYPYGYGSPTMLQAPVQMGQPGANYYGY